jgi:hypothetical protein
MFWQDQHALVDRCNDLLARLSWWRPQHDSYPDRRPRCPPSPSRHRSARCPRRACQHRIFRLGKDLGRCVGEDVGARYRRSLKIDPNGVEWEALSDEGRVVTGKLVLHAAVGETEVVSWAEVVVDERVDPVVSRVAREYMRRGEGLVPVDYGDGDGPVGDDGELLP